MDEFQLKIIRIKGVHTKKMHFFFLQMTHKNSFFCFDK